MRNISQPDIMLHNPDYVKAAGIEVILETIRGREELGKRTPRETFWGFST